MDIKIEIEAFSNCRLPIFYLLHFRMKRQILVFLCMVFVFASPVSSTIATTIGGLALNAAATTALATGLAASGAVGLALGYTVGRGSRGV